MRRVILTVFFCLTACGGGVSSPNPGVVGSSADLKAEYQRYLFTADAKAVIASYATVFSQSAIDTCLVAWVDDLGGQSGQDGPISKPDVKEFRSFLRECLGGPAPGDARGVGSGQEQRAVNGDSMRAVNGDSMRAANGDSMRAVNGDSMHTSGAVDSLRAAASNL